MAYTRIHNIKRTLRKALEYIENPTKTDHQNLVSGYNCEPLIASTDFEMTIALSKEIKGDYSRVGGSDNIAHHMIQSFSPFDKITPEEAHELGKKWANEILQGKHEYVISTHLDKGHIHNHVIFNATSFYDYSKFENYKVAKHLREVSDRLCEERGLFVIKNPNQKGKTHYEWEHRNAGTSWKAQLESIIANAIAKSKNYDEFKNVLSSENVEIKEGKHIAFRLPGQARFCRGKTIGQEFTKESILDRLNAPKEKMASVMQTFTSYDKKIEWEGRKTKLAATKDLADALLIIRKEGISQESDFKSKIETLSIKVSGLKEIIKDLDSKNMQYKNAAKYLVSYNKFLPIKQNLCKQNPLFRKKYESKYESELRAFEYATQQLEKMQVNTNVDPDKVITLVKEQDHKVAELNQSLKDATFEMVQIKKAQQLVGRLQQRELPVSKGLKKEQMELG